MRHVSSMLDEYREIFEQDEFEQLVIDLIDTFIEVTPKHLDQLKNAFLARDNDTFIRSAHTMKSSGGTFGATEFGAMAAELELLGCFGGLNSTKQLITRLEIEYASVKTHLKDLRNDLENS